MGAEVMKLVRTRVTMALPMEVMLRMSLARSHGEREEVRGMMVSLSGMVEAMYMGGSLDGLVAPGARWSIEGEGERETAEGGAPFLCDILMSVPNPRVLSANMLG
jgi:hypothetical protein